MTSQRRSDRGFCAYRARICPPTERTGTTPAFRFHQSTRHRQFVDHFSAMAEHHRMIDALFPAN